jgi:5-(hydroxymethyl)furfural/furfural oxidase
VQAPRTYWRGRGVGGSSAINGQIAIRGMAQDFDAWAAEGCEGWSFEEILPAFNRLETDLRFGGLPYHGDKGPIPIYRAPISKWGAVDQAGAEAALDLGYPWAPDHNAPGALGVSPYAINSIEDKRVSANDAYLEPARGRNNLAVFGDTQVDGVVFSGARAVGVRARKGTDWRDIRGREIILAAGAVHSPAILMRSGIGPRMICARSTSLFACHCPWAGHSRIIRSRPLPSISRISLFRRPVSAIPIAACATAPAFAARARAT